ncbi:MAG: hypothetical protein E7502_06355 [Ruminococcus sp.]|nr:hypothetical protein [Ruminococcus sp.]
MKKRFLAFLTAALCMFTPLSAHAVDVDADVDTAFTYITDTFTYKTNNAYGYGSGFFLETELAAPDFMVVGYHYEKGQGVSGDELIGYVISPINDETFLKNGVAEVDIYSIESHFGEKQLQIGDLFKVEGEWCAAEPTVYSYCFGEETELTYFGNGVDLLGKDFEKIVRLQMVIDEASRDAAVWEQENVTFIKGDTTVDDSVNILDCIQLNRAMLAGAPLCDYAKLAGDVNENGVLDMDDSLCILKETIGITENFK